MKSLEIFFINLDSLMFFSEILGIVTRFQRDYYYILLLSHRDYFIFLTPTKIK